eukprot:TRINITY_DN24015_c0_g1_i1.p1 TRINITY_DN24015_c0_g1~~TRINITY_DN24015_c0_g1_i1.p1  ORF type:complete len:490 (-),score=64.49 TRINITY_DN24015_c0_g1_i1:580-2049(-)
MRPRCARSGEDRELFSVEDANDAGSVHDTGRAFRVLTMNIALVSPGVATLRYYLQIILLSLPFSLLSYTAFVFSDLLHPVLGCALITYGVWGGAGARGLRVGLAVASGLICALCAFLLHCNSFAIPFHILASYGFLQLTFFVFAFLMGRLVILVHPSLINSYVDERVALFLKHLRDGGPYDVVCVQEVSVIWGREEFRKRLETGAARLGLQYVVWTGKWPRFPAVTANSGLGILSRYPFMKSSTKFRYFSEQYLVEWPYVQRGYLISSVLLPSGQRVDICNIHNTASIENTGSGTGLGNFGGTGNSLGARQVLEALESFLEFSPPVVEDASGQLCGFDLDEVGKTENDPLVESSSPEPATQLRIFCGDFNFEKDTQSFESVASLAKVRCQMFNVEHNGDGTFGTIEDGGPAEWCLTFPLDQKRPRVIDYIFADKAARTSRVVPMRNDDKATRHLYQQASDHCGVEAIFDLGHMKTAKFMPVGRRCFDTA